jgi:hypothetical protein
MLKLTVAVLVFAIAGSASAAGWRWLRTDGSDEASFMRSVAALQDKLSPARLYVFNRALQDLWLQGAESAEAQQREYAPAEYFQRLHGLGYDEIVALADPSGDTTKQRYAAALAQNRVRFPPPRRPVDRPAQIGPHGEQVRGIVDTGPAYQHQLSTMGQR